MVRWLARTARALRALLRRTGAERDLDEELRFHLDMDAGDWIRRGVDPSRAAEAARRQFGPMALIKEQVREVRITSTLEHLMRDIRGALRSVRRSPGFAVAVIATLGLGIGAVTTMYSITSGILRPLPVPEPDRLVHVAGGDRRTGEDDLRLGTWELVTLRTQQRSLRALSAYQGETFHVGDGDRLAQRWPGAWMTPDALAALQIEPLLGRGLLPEDGAPEATPVVLLGHRLWTRRYEADPTISGRLIRINGVVREVVGVMPEGFRFPVEHDLWLPLSLPASAAPDSGSAWVGFGRLRDGVSLEEARAEFDALGARLAATAPATHANRTVQARAYREELIPTTARIIFRVMLLVVSFVLLVACANAANLLLARAMARRHEVAVRSALGAGRSRLVVQLLTEVLVLAAAAGLAGVGLARAAIVVFNRMVGFELAYWMKVQVDGSVLLVAGAAVLVATIAAGLGPARQALGISLGDALRERVRGSMRLGKASQGLVGFEIALSGALLVITALMVSGVLRQVDRFGQLTSAGVLTARLELRPEAYPDTASVAAFYRTLHDRLSVEPAIEGVALGSVLPGFQAETRVLRLEGRDVPAELLPATRVLAASPGLLATVGAHLIEGRDLTWNDGPEQPPVALVNHRFVERYFEGDSPIGRRIRLGAGETEEWVTIVGVVPDLQRRGREGDDIDAVYLSLLQTDQRNAAVLLRLSGAAPSLAPTLRNAVRAIDPDVPLFEEATLDQVIALETSSEKLFGGLFTAFGLSALMMASVGLFGMVAFTVRQRSRELGIRQALGARPQEIVRQVAWGASLQLGLGLVFGLGLAALLAPLFGDALMGADPHDWRWYAVVAGTLAGVGILAAGIPARRALRLSPSQVLREESSP